MLNTIDNYRFIGICMLYKYITSYILYIISLSLISFDIDILARAYT